MSKRMARSTTRTLSVVLVLLVLVSGFASAQPRSVTASFVQWAKLTASDGTGGDGFGSSVSTSGDTVVIGSDESAYVFERDAGGTGKWGQAAKLTASDGAAGDEFGRSVSISGDTVVVGARLDDLILGSAYVFERDAGGAGNWGQVAKLTASDGSGPDAFGSSVSISGDTLVVGATGVPGWVYLFEKPVTGWPANMTETAKLTASDAPVGGVGESVSVSGDTVLFSVPLGTGNEFQSGSAYLFERDAGGPENWGQVAKLTASDGASGDEFGKSVSISGDTAVVGAWQDDSGSGSAYVYGRDEGGLDNWGQVAKLTASDGTEGDHFGYAVSISGDTVVAGAFTDDDIGSEAGSAYLFEKPGAGWGDMTETAKLTASDVTEYDQFGSSVSISGDTVVAGAGGNYAEPENPGSAYVFIEFEPVAWVYLPVVLRSAP